jgi:hypothetical protein
MNGNQPRRIHWDGQIQDRAAGSAARPAANDDAGR